MQLSRIVPKALCVIMLLALQACGHALPESMNVATAYESSGSLAVTPYTRTIFSTHNF